MSESVKKDLIKRAKDVSLWLENCLKDFDIPCGLREAMGYSLLAGGKRIRPVLCLASAGVFAKNKKHFMPFACALESIHTYSLIHDDLPAMDDDDLRRGKASNHKKFDEATAILAGDALLTDAFFFMAETGIKNTNIPAERVLRAISEASKAAGSCGMVGGQFLDMNFELSKEFIKDKHYALHKEEEKKGEREESEEDLKLNALAKMHSMKTGALLSTACVCGAILAGADEQGIESMRSYGKSFGAAFQIIDDILDITGTEEELGKPVGSDADMNKVTYPSLIGLEKSRILAQEKTDLAVRAIEPYTNNNANFLRELAKYMLKRLS